MKKTNDCDKPNNNDDELERIFNLSGKNESFESESNNSSKNNKSTVKDFYYESEEEFNEELLKDGVTAIIGISEDCSFNEARDFTYYFYHSENEYNEEKVIFNSYFKALLNYNNTLKRINHKIDKCKKNNVSYKNLEISLDELSRMRENFYDNCWIYFNMIKNDIDEILKVTTNVIVKNANSLYGNIDSLNDILLETQIVHPKMKRMFDAFKAGEENFDVLDFSDRRIVNLVNNYIEYQRLYEFIRFYDSVTELFEEYYNEYKLNGKYNNSPFKTQNQNIVTMSKAQVEELLEYCVLLNTEYLKKSKMQNKNFIKSYSNVNHVVDVLRLSGLNDDEIKQQMIWYDKNIKYLQRTINKKYIIVNDTGKLVYELAKRLKQVNTSHMTAGASALMNFFGMIDNLSLNSFASPKKTEHIFVHINEIKDIIKGLQESSKSASIINKLISETFGDKLNNAQNPQFS